MTTLEQLQPNAVLRVSWLFLKVHALLAAPTVPRGDPWKKMSR